MLTDLRNSKGSTELSAMAMWNVVGKVTNAMLPQLTLLAGVTIP